MSAREIGEENRMSERKLEKLPLTRQAAKLLLRNVPMRWRGKRTPTGIYIFAFTDRQAMKEARSFIKRLYKFETENPPLSFAPGAINNRPVGKLKSLYDFTMPPMFFQER